MPQLNLPCSFSSWVIRANLFVQVVAVVHPMTIGGETMMKMTSIGHGVVSSRLTHICPKEVPLAYAAVRGVSYSSHITKGMGCIYRTDHRNMLPLSFFLSCSQLNQSSRTFELSHGYNSCHSNVYHGRNGWRTQ